MDQRPAPKGIDKSKGSTPEAFVQSPGMWTLGPECTFFNKTYFLPDKNFQNKYLKTLRI